MKLPTSAWDGLDPREVHRLEALEHADPHTLLGVHPTATGVVIRAWRPDAVSVAVVLPGGGSFSDAQEVPLARMTAAGLWGISLSDLTLPVRYALRAVYANGTVNTAVDPYGFLPTLGAMDLHLASEGTHQRLYDKLGAHPRILDGVEGVSFAVWAPNARRISVVGDFNHWDGRQHPMRRLGASGIWELFIPGIAPGELYKFELLDARGKIVLKLDPLAFATQVRPDTAGVIAPETRHPWRDSDWMSARATRDPLHAPMSVYEVHLGSWMRVPGEGNRWLTYRELAGRLGDYVVAMGFTHVEFLPLAEHPLDASWGYQVTGYFAPTARFGTADDLRYLVDELHQRGVGVLLDWVPAHFPRDAFALARFDGTALYEHADPRQGEHPDWGTLIFNFGRTEVRNFLIANALYWLESFHVDGLRVDAVAAMLYLDYSRKPGAWVPNVHGGRENLDAVSFLQELNTRVHGCHPGAMVMAEESTAWPAVSRPVYTGGLGFTFKWNMGWMHDTLGYFTHEPVHRRYHHQAITFGLLYAWSENFILPLSHDEVVHLKGSLLGKMPGDRWQRFASLRALYGHLWAHPGKKLLFMGGEFAQDAEWSHDRSLDWHLLADPLHAGVSRLVRDLNDVYRSHPALWALDTDPAGFQWISANDTEQSVAAYLRHGGPDAQTVVCILNATPVVRHGYRIGVPHPGVWREAINTDAEIYGGSNQGNGGSVVAVAHGTHGFPWSVELTLPPLSVLWLVAPPGSTSRVDPG